MSEVDWGMVHRIEAAAQKMSDAAQQAENAAMRIATMLEDGSGGNGVRLIEALESAGGPSKDRIAACGAELLATRAVRTARGQDAGAEGKLLVDLDELAASLVYKLDYACAQCHPNGRYLADNFTCLRHRAEAAIAARDNKF